MWRLARPSSIPSRGQRTLRAMSGFPGLEVEAGLRTENFPTSPRKELGKYRPIPPMSQAWDGAFGLEPTRPVKQDPRETTPPDRPPTSISNRPKAGPPNSQLITPCIDLTSLTGCVALEFYYHKFGSTMGNMRLDIDTSKGMISTNIGGAIR